MFQFVTVTPSSGSTLICAYWSYSCFSNCNFSKHKLMSSLMMV